MKMYMFFLGVGCLYLFSCYGQAAQYDEKSAGAAQKRKPAGPLPGFEISETELSSIYGRPVMLVPVVKHAPTIDADPNDPVWKNVKGIQLGYLDSKFPGIETVNPTTVKIVSDKKHLYLLAKCHENNVEKIKVHDDCRWTDDIVDLEFDIGRSLDYQQWYLAEVNSKGSFMLRRNRFDSRWKPKSLIVKGKVYNKQWVVELKIAFKDFAVDKDNFPKVWGANFFRSRWVDRPSWDDPNCAKWDLAWHGNSHGRPHFPYAFGILYFQAGNKIPEELARLFKQKGKGLSKAGLKKYEHKQDKTLPLASKPKRIARFAKKPEIVQKDNHALISFAVLKPVDVAVGIMNEKGTIVRHLAAGVLGKNPPKPLKPNTLEQKLVWDYLDDKGKEVPKGRYTVQVNLGLDVTLDKTLLWSPYQFRTIKSIATGPDGTLYVIHGINPHRTRFTFIQAYDRDGKYLRQIYPMPGNLPAEKMAGASPIRYEDGSWIPTMHQVFYHMLLPWTSSFERQSPAVTDDGRIILVTSGGPQLRVPERLVAIGTDGSVKAGYAGPVIVQEEVVGNPCVAVSGDGKYYYVTGLRGRNLWPVKGGKSHHVVYRFKWDDPVLQPTEFFAKPFIGTIEQSGAGKDLLNDPAGIDVDKQGNLYIADKGNNRIAVFDQNGTYVSQIDVNKPCAVRVNPKIKAVYVLTNGKGRCSLKKIDTTSKKLITEVEIKGGHLGILALDKSAPTPCLWIAYPNRIIQFKDQGNTIESKGNVIKNQGARGYPVMASSFEFVVDPEKKKLYMGKAIYDTETGAYVGELPKEVRGWSGTVPGLQLGPDGYFYTVSDIRSGIRVSRYDRDLKPALFPGLGKHYFEKKIYKKGGYNPWSFCVTLKGNIVFLSDKNGYRGVNIFDPSGKQVRENFITIKQDFRCQWRVIRMDSQGDVYIGTPLRKRGQMVQPEVQGRIPRYFGQVFDPKPYFYFHHYTGSVVKFSNSGALLSLEPDGEYIMTRTGSGMHYCKAKGVEWSHFGFSPKSLKETAGNTCECTQGSYDLDRFDRLFIPYSLLYSVQVIDRNNNPILRFGRYGNTNEKGLVFSWPRNVVVDDRYVYIGDSMNDRIVRGKLVYKKAEECIINKE